MREMKMNKGHYVGMSALSKSIKKCGVARRPILTVSIVYRFWGGYEETACACDRSFGNVVWLQLHGAGV